MSGTFKVDGSGNVDFQEEDGIDYAPVTVQVGIPEFYCQALEFVGYLLERQAASIGIDVVMS